MSKIWSEKSNAEGDLEDVLETVELASRQVERNSEYTQFLDVILSKFLDYKNLALRQVERNSEYTHFLDVKVSFSITQIF